MEWINDLALAATILFGIFGLVLTFIIRDMDHCPKRLYVAILSLAVADAVLEVLAKAIYPFSPPFYQALYLIDTVIVPLPSLLVFAYFLYCCGETYRKSPVMLAQCVLIAAVEITGILGQISGEINTVPGGNLRISFVPILCTLLVTVSSVVRLVALIRRRKKLKRVQQVMFLVCFLTSVPIQIILVELYLIADIVWRYLEQKDEAVRQRAQVAVLQMRPHFIHNTLMSIYFLCAQDPQKAQQVILDFSRYLQSNFTAIAQEGTIPFAKELEHTRAYLAVEQARFQGRLFVEFDTPNTFFRIPVLTLQPIVENAVEHGVRENEDGAGTVTVSTREYSDRWEITVSDDGPGFDPDEIAGDGERHIGLKNVRERLRHVSGGGLRIESAPGKGCRVTIELPKEGGGNDADIRH